MQRSMGFILVVVFFFASTGLLWSANIFMVTAAIPSATGVKITAATIVENPVTHAIISYTPIDTTDLTFSAMTYDSTNKIWTPPNYFAIDIANTGVGSPNVAVVYADGGKPAGQAQGLGNRATIAFKKVVWVDASHNNETDIAGHPRKALIAANDSFLPATTAGGWFKMYIGVATDASVANAAPFTNADQPGSYSGTVTVTATPS